MKMKRRVISALAAAGLAIGLSGFAVGTASATPTYTQFAGLGCSAYYGPDYSGGTYYAYSQNINCTYVRAGISYIANGTTPTTTYSTWVSGTTSKAVATTMLTGRYLGGQAPTGDTWEHSY